LSVIVVTVVVVLAATENPAFAAVTLFSFLGLILLHEWGHGAVAHHFGYSVEGIWLAAIHGRCEFQAPDSEWERSLIAWGGVAAQLALAVPIIILDSVWHGSVGIFGPVVLILGYYSCFVAILNLLPIKGLDGPRAWRIVPLLRKRLQARGVVRNALGRSRRK
jgi:membrane-associated protease RseP (regulator of RpoE activity)